MDSARGLACLMVLACVLGVPATALADTTSSVDRGGARAPGLTRAERNALDIRSIRATGGPWGVIVQARFRGNVRAIGRGRLRRALVAMVLHPRTDDQGAVALATQGPLGRTDTLRSTRSEEVAVVRDGRRIDFLVFGGGLENVERIEVKAFARRPTRRARAAAELEISDGELARLLDAASSDTASVDAPSVDDPNVCVLLREAAVIYVRQYRRRVSEIRRATGQREVDLSRIISQLEAARRRLRPTLGRNRCFSVSGDFGYEHFEGYTIICGDFVYDLPVALPGQARLFRRNDAGDFVEVFTRFEELPSEDELTRFSGFFRIEDYGTYRIDYRDIDLEDDLEVVIEVPRPLPQQTRDCGP